MDQREKNLEVIRAACVKANPEIVKLKEGCIVLAGDALLPHTIYGCDEGMFMAYGLSPAKSSKTG
jgi:hypothetical protein